LSAIKENIMMFLYTVLISQSIDASTRAKDPNKYFFFIFAPQWVTEEKIKQPPHSSYFKKKTSVHNDACKSCSEFELINILFQTQNFRLANRRTTKRENTGTGYHHLNRTSDYNV
jgi:hypothetical protein